jgi:hypothetical protein
VSLFDPRPDVLELDRTMGNLLPFRSHSPHFLQIAGRIIAFQWPCSPLPNSTLAQKLPLVFCQDRYTCKHTAWSNSIFNQNNSCRRGGRSDVFSLDSGLLRQFSVSETHRFTILCLLTPKMFGISLPDSLEPLDLASRSPGDTVFRLTLQLARKLLRITAYR